MEPWTSFHPSYEEDEVFRTNLGQTKSFKLASIPFQSLQKPLSHQEGSSTLFSMDNRSATSIDTTYAKPDFACILCRQSHGTVLDLQYHMGTCHEPAGYFVCGNCTQRSADFESHLQHQTSCHPKYVGHICGKRLESDLKLQFGCNRGFINLIELHEHMVSQEGQKCEKGRPIPTEVPELAWPLLIRQPKTEEQIQKALQATKLRQYSSLRSSPVSPSLTNVDSELSFQGLKISPELHRVRKQDAGPLESTFIEELASRFVQRYLVADNRTHPAEGSHSSNKPSQTAAKSTQMKHVNSSKRPLRPAGNGGFPQDNDDDDQQPAGRKRARAGKGGKTTLLACPYAKHNPRRFSALNTTERKYRNCATGFLTDISRLKQHLKRTHMRPEYFCVRCYDTFKSREDLFNHKMVDPPCSARAAKYEEKMTDEQYGEIQRRAQGSSERDSWYKIYQILFPDEPVPVSHFQDSSATIEHDADDSTTLRHFVTFINRVGVEELRQLLNDTKDNDSSLEFEGSATQIVLNRAFEIAVSTFLQQEPQDQPPPTQPEPVDNHFLPEYWDFFGPSGGSFLLEGEDFLNPSILLPHTEAHLPDELEMQSTTTETLSTNRFEQQRFNTRDEQRGPAMDELASYLTPMEESVINRGLSLVDPYNSSGFMPSGYTGDDASFNLSQHYHSIPMCEEEGVDRQSGLADNRYPSTTSEYTFEELSTTRSDISKGSWARF